MRLARFLDSCCVELSHSSSIGDILRPASPTEKSRILQVFLLMHIVAVCYNLTHVCQILRLSGKIDVPSFAMVHIKLSLSEFDFSVVGQLGRVGNKVLARS